jgi:hypothetical protein
MPILVRNLKQGAQQAKFPYDRPGFNLSKPLVSMSGEYLWCDARQGQVCPLVP